jgi:hypothetical protein
VGVSVLCMNVVVDIATLQVSEGNVLTVRRTTTRVAHSI